MDGAFWARAFARLLERHRRDDGSKWSGAALERATGGRVRRKWVSDLLAERISEPGASKLWAVSRAIGAELDEWFEEARSERE